MRLHIEKVAAKDGLRFDFVDDYLTAEMLVAEVECHFGDSVCTYFISLQLRTIVLYNFFYFFMQSEHMMLRFGNPLLFAVVFESEDSWRNDPMDDHRLDLL